MHPFIWEKYKVIPNYTYRIDLNKSLDDIYSNYDPKNRNKINACLKQELSMKEDGLSNENVFAFFKHALLLAGANVYEAELKNIFLKFSNPTNSFCLSAFQNGQLQGAVFCAYDKEVCNYLFGGIFTNQDFESYAVDRDKTIRKLLEDNQIGFRTYKDHVIFEKNEVVKDDGEPYTVFTPYKRKWLEKLSAFSGAQEIFQAFQAYRSEDYTQGFCNTLKSNDCPELSAMGFERSSLPMPTVAVPQAVIKNYDKDRDYPAIIGTSRLGLHFRFGTISIREKAKKAMSLNQTFLSELIWRDFYAQILYHFPHVQKGSFPSRI